MDGLKSPRGGGDRLHDGRGSDWYLRGKRGDESSPGGAPRPPCHASACSFHLARGERLVGPVSVRAAKLYRMSVVPGLT